MEIDRKVSQKNDKIFFRNVLKKLKQNLFQDFQDIPSVLVCVWHVYYVFFSN